MADTTVKEFSNVLGADIEVKRHQLADGSYTDNLKNMPGSPVTINSATTTAIANQRVYIKRIRVVAGTMGNVTVYKGGISDPVHFPTNTPAKGDVLAEDVLFDAGCTIVTAAATVLEISYVLMGAA